MTSPALTIALPNKGRLCDETMGFLEACALTVRRDNERQYQAKMTGISHGVEVVFQRARDIPKVVGEGRIDLGVTGLDIFSEMGGQEATRCFPVFPDIEEEEKRKIPCLPYGNCALVIAVPDHWVDISTVSDLAELAIVRKKENKMLRVATEFPNLTKKFLFRKGVSYFEVTTVYGAAESAPRMGSADLVSDLRSSGVTLSENRLKEIGDGTILSSGACLIASDSLRRESEGSPRLDRVKSFIDRIEAHLSAKKYWLITANVLVDKAEESQLRAMLSAGLSDEDLKLLGQEGPTVAKVLSLDRGREKQEKTVYSLSILVQSGDLERGISILREKTGRNILVTPLSFVYDNQPRAYAALMGRLRQ